VTQYYRLLHQAGDYKLVWKPYNGAIESNPLTISIIGEQQAVIKTNYGNMTVRFYYDEAPEHVKNFIELVEKRFYNNLSFHRIIPGAIVQGGCPRGDGYGVRPDGKRLQAEFNDIPFKKGTVGMARSPKDPDSASCQFFICLSRQPSFDGEQTAFGYLVGEKSFEVLDKIANIDTTGSPKFRPLKDEAVYINTISLENVPREKSRRQRNAARERMQSGQDTGRSDAAKEQALSRRRELSQGMRVMQRQEKASTTQPAVEQGG
jgi:cyclophilin family peptidyl-prolyl cis-trans isomerase